MTALLNPVHRGCSSLPVALVIASGALALSQEAHAQRWPPPLQCTMSTTPSTISFNAIDIPRDAPIGTNLSEIRTTVTTVRCPVNVPYWIWSRGPGFLLQYYPLLPVSTTVPNAWETGMPGIGVRVINNDYHDFALSAVGPPGPYRFGQQINASAFSGTFRFTYQLVKTGSATVSGTLSIGELFRLVSYNTPYNVTSPTLSSVGITNTSITARSCSVSTTSFGVTMPTVLRSSLDRVGASVGSTSFRISVGCQRDTRVQVYMTMTDGTTPANWSDLLTLTRGSTARGVQLRIKGPTGQPVRFGPASPNARAQSQFLVGPSESTTDIPFTVEYVATGAVTPGSVRGLATFTMSYQ